MKKVCYIFFFLILNFSTAFSQGNVMVNEKEENESIQQIKTSGLSDILSFQMQNQGVSNMTMTQQIGNWNKSSVSQQSDAGSAFANQTYSIQQGNSNEMTIGQIGSGNLLLGFQLGYITRELEDEKKEDQYKNVLESYCTLPNDNDGTATQSLVIGERNELKVGQNGTKNAIVAIQQGSDNKIDAEQDGTNNYLVIYQKGNKNEVIGYKQENNSSKVLAETIIQEGEGLILNTSDVSKSKPNGNSFIQKGINLTLEVNNQFTNTLGGIEVTQSGRDMKVVIDQSFFSFPTQ